MVLWICVGLVVLGLLGLAVLTYEVHSHLSRFQRAVADAQRDTVPQIALFEEFVEAARAELSSTRR